MAAHFTRIESADLNDLTDAGNYYIVSASSNYPSNFSQYLGVEVKVFSGTIVQTAYCTGEVSKYAYVRKYTGYHGWTYWESLC